MAFVLATFRQHLNSLEHFEQGVHYVGTYTGALKKDINLARPYEHRSHAEVALSQYGKDYFIAETVTFLKESMIEQLANTLTDDEFAELVNLRSFIPSRGYSVDRGDGKTVKVTVPRK